MWRAARAWAASTYEMNGVARRNLAMEGLRGFAVVLVFFVHFDSLFARHLDVGSATRAVSGFLANIGLAGVDLFFVLSGYLIYGAVMRRSGDTGRFLARRVQRIYPTFLVVFGLYLVLSAVFPEENKIPPGYVEAAIYVAQNALLLPGMFDIVPIVTVAWSLSYELFYYLLIPLVVGVTGMRGWTGRQRVLLFGGSVVVGAGACLVNGYDFHLHLALFVSGILLHEALRVGWVVKGLDAWGAVALVVTLGGVFALDQAAGAWPAWEAACRVGGVMLLFVGFFVLTLACFAREGRLAKAFAWTPLRWLGNMSYSYYLIHGLTLKALAVVAAGFPVLGTSGGYWLVLPVAFAATWGASTVLYVAVEKRFSMGMAVARPMVA